MVKAVGWDDYIMGLAMAVVSDYASLMIKPSFNTCSSLLLQRLSLGCLLDMARVDSKPL